MRNHLLAALVALPAILVPGVSFAGAGANVYVCLYVPTKPITPLQVQVTVAGSGTHCMNATGQNTSFVVAAAGTTCGSVGYVEAKASSTKGDLCATDPSNWPASYSIPGTGFTGATNTNWHTGTQTNSVDLQNAATGTSVCGNSNLCTQTTAQWNAGTQGPLYIIFQPQAK